ncbi:GNAT family N-acetyltransferase [Streptomyces sp. NPDC002935]|uniref:GNAT family N-acetyltransferase n=1 Tax=Streptomyces sp. NPDC002935 TaxID=3154545 RepID=UPI0033AC8CEA
MAVAPERRGDKIGEALVKAFINEYTAAHYEVLYAQVGLDKPTLARWYSRMGFEALGAGTPLRLTADGRVAIFPEGNEQLIVCQLSGIENI